MKLTLGTRGSALALAQADMVTAALEAAIPGIEVERHIMCRRSLRSRSSAADTGGWCE